MLSSKRRSVKSPFNSILQNTDDFTLLMLKVIIAENVEKSSLEMNEGTSIEYLNGVEASNIIIDIEEEFGITFDVKKFYTFKTIKDLKDYMDKTLETNTMSRSN